MCPGIEILAAGRANSGDMISKQHAAAYALIQYDALSAILAHKSGDHASTVENQTTVYVDGTTIAVLEFVVTARLPGALAADHMQHFCFVPFETLGL